MLAESFVWNGRLVSEKEARFLNQRLCLSASTLGEEWVDRLIFESAQLRRGGQDLVNSLVRLNDALKRERERIRDYAGLHESVQRELLAVLKVKLKALQDTPSLPRTIAGNVQLGREVLESRQAAYYSLGRCDEREKYLMGELEGVPTVEALAVLASAVDLLTHYADYEKYVRGSQK